MNYGNMSIENMLETAIFTWLPLSEGAALCCVNVPEKTRDYFEMRGINVTYIGIDELVKVSDCINEKDQFDCVIAFEVIENSSVPKDSVRALLNMITDKGVVYLGTDNRLGLRYFCGDTEPGTGKPFAAVEDYNSIDKNVSLRTRLYARNEIEAILDDAGCVNRKFYSVLPNLKAAQLIYADGYMPRERLATRYMPMYRNPEGIFAREEWMYDSIIRNGMFHQMSNAYLIEIRPDHKLSDVLHVTLSADRGELNSCATLVYDDKVEKRAICPEGENRLIKIKENDDDIRRHGVHVVDSEIIDGVYVMPRIEAPILERVLQQLLASDQEAYLKLFDRYRDVVYSSSDMIENSAKGPVLRRCYIDMVPLNCFYLNDDFLFYDQEFYLENEAANLILWRALVIVYDSNPTLNGIISINEMMDRYGITPYAEEYSRKSGEFIWSLRNQEELAEFNRKNLRDINKVMDNRRKVERALIDWDARRDKLKETCFDDLAGRDIYVFGSGRFADEFICMYRYDYKIAGVLDNNTGKHGADFYGYQISSPEMLSGLDPDSYKVIVCIKNCNDILMQLDDMGVKTDHIGVFDIHYFYPGRQKYLPGNDGMASYQEFYKAQSAVETGASGKHYHVGYIAGVFDLFHLGHLNMFRRAKEMCDYLIVGVVSDDGVTVKKGAELFIPFEERIEMVRSCKYVDEAVEIPYVYCRTPEAFRKYHFDVQFSGSDYINDPGWLAMKAYLEEHGSALEFLSYTQQTSSTKIKALINTHFTVPSQNEKFLYNKGYCMACVDEDYRNYLWMKEIAEKCKYFILGIPDRNILSNLSAEKNFDSIVDYWSNIKWIDEIIILNEQMLDYQHMYNELKFDFCVSGSYYGKKYIEDKKFFAERNVEFKSLVPDRYKVSDYNNAVNLVLDHNRVNKKIILFGTGKYFDYYMEYFGEKFVPYLAVDNANEKWGKEKSGVTIYSPSILRDFSADEALIIVCARDYAGIVEQINAIEDFEWRILLNIDEIASLEEYRFFKSKKQLTDETLEKVQKINYDMLESFDSLCRKNGIEYFLFLGSMLGALRHQAMIPWDNDIDTVLKRWEGDKVLNHKDELDDRYFWLGHDILGKDKYFDCINRIGYKEAYLNMTNGSDKFYGNYFNSIHLDMFLIDRTYDNFWGKFQRYELAVLYGLMNAYRHESLFDDYSPKMKFQNKILCTVGKFIPLKWLKKKADKVARRFDQDEKAPYYFISNDVFRSLMMLFPAEWFDHSVDVPFGNMTAQLAVEGDLICRKFYGDYMQLPPEEARVPHIGRLLMSADSYVFKEPKRGGR